MRSWACPSVYVDAARFERRLRSRYAPLLGAEVRPRLRAPPLPVPSRTHASPRRAMWYVAHARVLTTLRSGLFPRRAVHLPWERRCRPALAR